MIGNPTHNFWPPTSMANWMAARMRVPASRTGWTVHPDAVQDWDELKKLHARHRAG